MSYDYKRTAKTAERIISRFGISAIAKNIITSDFIDPDNPDDVGEEIITTGKVVRDELSYQYSQKNQSLIVAGDCLLWCDSGLDIRENTQVVTSSGIKYNIIKPNPIAPADVIVAYSAHAREVV